MFVLQNNGKAGNLTNACLFISVHDYIKYVLNITDVTVKDIREIGKFPGGKHTMFDTDASGHTEALRRIADVYDLSVHFYGNHSPHGTFAGTCWKTVGNGKNNLSIIAYGGHFELIVSETPKSEMLQLNKLHKTDRRRVNKIQSIFPTVMVPSSSLPDEPQHYVEEKDIIEISSIDTDSSMSVSESKHDIDKIMCEDFKMLIEITNRDIRKFLDNRKNQLAMEKHSGLLKEIRDMEDMIKQIHVSIEIYNDQIKNIENMSLTLVTLLHDKTIDRTKFNADMAKNVRDRMAINTEVERTTAILKSHNEYIERLNREKSEFEIALRPYFAMMQTVERVQRHIVYLSK
jgi:hypothetical protein